MYNIEVFVLATQNKVCKVDAKIIHPYNLINFKLYNITCARSLRIRLTRKQSDNTWVHS